MWNNANHPRVGKPDSGVCFYLKRKPGRNTEDFHGCPLQHAPTGIQNGTSRVPSPTRVRGKWYDTIVGACCRAQRIFNLNDCRWQSYLDSLIDRPREADSLPNDKNQTSERFTSAQRRELFQGRALWGRGNMLRFLPTVDRPHLKRLPGSVLWLPFLPNKKVPPPAGCNLESCNRVAFQGGNPSVCPPGSHLPLHKGGFPSSNCIPL